MKAMNDTMTGRAARRADHIEGEVHVDQGFTLMEIVIAIALVGILSAVAVVGIGSLTSKGSKSACTSSLDAAKAASVVHFAGSAAYPTSLTQMTTTNPAELTLPSGVTLNGNGRVARGSGWTLTMTVGANGQPPTFVCT